MEKIAILDSLHSKYPMLDEVVISIALDATRWDVDTVTILLEEEKEENARVGIILEKCNMRKNSYLKVVFEYFV